MRLWIAVTTLCAACGPSSAPAPTQARAAVSEERLAMGSLLRLTAWTSDEAAARAAFAAVFTEFDRLEGLLSVWRPGSDVERINTQALQAPVAVRQETREVLRAAAQVSAWTEGGFDVTFGALAEIWKFDHDQDGRVPGAAEIAAHRARVDYRAVVVDDGPGTVRLARPGVHVHLGGIGKGYAVDRAVAMLRRAGLTDFMVQAGGDLYVAGRAGDTPWRLGIQDPRGAGGEPFAVVELADATFSTSGDYERFFVKDGVRYHHILDPRTAQPARASRSVTIMAKDAFTADAWSKVLFILGAKQAMALVEKLPDFDAVFVDADNHVIMSSGLKDRIKVIAEPTPGV